MGGFIDMASVNASYEALAQILGSDFEGLIDCGSDKSLIIYENATGDFSRVSSLSKELDVAAFGLHIHDDDLWMYQFYVSGELVDRFNPIPEYWEEVSADEKSKWKGDADLISRHWPEVKSEQIAKYLQFHHSPGFDSQVKAYSTDKFEPWDAWQVCDFLKKLGTPYPAD